MRSRCQTALFLAVLLRLSGCLLLAVGWAGVGHADEAGVLEEIAPPETARAEEPTRERRDPVPRTEGPLTVTGGNVFTENQILYGIGRVTIRFGEIEIAADRMAINALTQVAEAEGNVVLTSPQEEIRATSVRYDFRRDAGVAYGVEGVTGRIFFRSVRDDEDLEGPSFRRVSEDEAIFLDTSYTTSGFPVPTWYIRADEITLIPGERWFMRNATLYIRGVPVFLFPAYTASFEGGSPWSIELGYMSRYGAYTRIGYAFEHEVLVPDWEDPDEYRTRSRGRLGVRADIFGRGAAGFGVDYRYRFDFDRHIGSLSLYGVRDSVRNVPEESTPDTQRWIYRHRHNTMFEQTIAQLNVDWMSDPDIYYDLVDPFDSAGRRGRLQERRTRAALTYLEEDWVARFSVELKERISLPRYQDFTDLQDDDLNYDPDPDFTQAGDRRRYGIPRDRYGRVSEKYEGRVATRMLPFFRTPLYWNAEANAFNNLDPGFNEIASHDDARIAGADAYGALSHRVRLDQNNRFTWLNSVGVGAGYYQRSTDRLIARRDAPPNLGDGTVVGVDGQRFVDERTVLLGDSGRQASFADGRPEHLWADYRSRLSARMSENVSGFLQYTLRRGTSGSAGEFYRRTGRVEAFEDVYDFPVDRHWLEGFLEYSPLFPKITTYAGAGVNLEPRSNVFANEQKYYVTTGADYENDSGEWRLGSSITYDVRQARERQDPNSFNYQEIRGLISADYVPRHGRYWAGIDVSGHVPISDDPVPEPARKRARFTENAHDVAIRPRVGRQLGPKYEVELFTEYSTRMLDFREGGVIIKRDLYDADLMVQLGFRTTSFRERDMDDESGSGRPEGDKELNVRVGLAFKIPEERAGLGAVSIQTMRDQRPAPVFVE